MAIEARASGEDGGGSERDDAAALIAAAPTDSGAMQRPINASCTASRHHNLASRGKLCIEDAGRDAHDRCVGPLNEHERDDEPALEPTAEGRAAGAAIAGYVVSTERHMHLAIPP
ncbi:hypothetical protein B0H14DRAFT_3905930 [Mycena olivaceomarginata]|nr:hypothetical protein B0H14DRAFT_3905930 [Mycena olivaceomarginata]